MNKIILFFIFLLPFCCSAQQQKSIDVYYGVKNSILFEYGRFFKYDKYALQSVGMDIGVGHVFSTKELKTSIGFRGMTHSHSKFDYIYKMGIVLYDFKYYDVFIGFGMERKKVHAIMRLNIIRTIAGNFDEEWAEFGIGVSF